MNPKEEVKKATGAQCATLASMIAVELTKRFDGKLTFDQAQSAITDQKQKVVILAADRFVNEIFSIPTDAYLEEKKKISHFYKSCFKDKKWQNPNWEQVAIPEQKENLKRLEYIWNGMTEDEAFEAYALYFGKDKAWKYYDSISKKIKTVQNRPSKNYVMLHVGGIEPDLLGKSYNDGIGENLIFMVPLEGIISAFRHRFETGEMYDIVGVTRFSALDHCGSAVGMGQLGNGEFNVGRNFRDSRLSNYGLRQVSF